jgi:peptidoglycan/LPS O-acetylase OafA/YrhL
VSDRAPNAFYRPELDALRFLAFFAVFIVHVTQYYSTETLSHHHVPLAIASTLIGLFHAGAYGVDLFFALSAYLITALLLREKAQTGRLHIGKFYIRRILRIWPLYYTLVLGLTFIPFFNPDREFNRYCPAFMLFLGNWAFVRSGWPASPAVPLWSVSVEEQFYLFWPPIVARLSRRNILVTAIVCIAIANIVRFLALLQHSSTQHIWSNTGAHLDSLGAGILIASLLEDRVPRFTLPARLCLVALGVVCLTARGLQSDLAPTVPLTPLLVIVGYPAVTVGCGAILLGFLGAPVRSPALRYLGKISYGLYGYHLACLFVVDALGVGSLRPALALALTVAVAAVSYELLEKPFLALKGRYTLVPSRAP